MAKILVVKWQIPQICNKNERYWFYTFIYLPEFISNTDTS